MKLKTITMSLACAIGLAGTMFGATLDNVQTSVIPGEWTSSFSAAKSYAEANGVPMLVFWSSPGCAKCNKMKTACNSTELVSWRKSRKLIMVFSEGDSTVKAFARNSSGDYPYMRLYWPKGGVDLKFTGRSTSIRATGSTLQAQLMNYVDANIKAWISGGGDPGSGTTIEPIPTSEQPSTPTPVDLSAWKKSRYLYGSYYENGKLAGRIQVMAGKVNAKGVARIKASVMGFDGRAKTLATKVFTVSSPTVGILSGAGGSYAFKITGSQISGTLTRNGVRYEVKPVKTGGGLADGTLTFTLETYPTTCQSAPVAKDKLPFAQKFTIASSKWKFSSANNPSNLKLTYKSANGYFKGTFYVYTQSGKRYAAKVAGFMVGDSGEGTVTIANVGTYRCAITR